MNTLRLSTLSLSLAVAIVTLGFAAPAFAGKKCDEKPKHPSCKDDPSSSITYTVELMGRVFHFDPPVNVTPNEKENALFPDAGELTFSRPLAEDVDARDAWDAVFASCENFFGPNTIKNMGPTPIVVSAFTVLAGNWRINKAGGVRLVMFDIPFDKNGNSPPKDSVDFTVTLQLIGHTFFNETDASWLPVPDSESGAVAIEYDMFDSWIHGGTVKGVHPRKSCVSKGGTEIIMGLDSGSGHTLKIEANLVDNSE